MSRLRKLIICSLVIVSALELNPIGVNAEWKQDNTGWWYEEEFGWATGWRIIDGQWYYFYTNGYMAHDTTIDGWYLNSSGSLVTSYDMTNYNKLANYIDEKIRSHSNLLDSTSFSRINESGLKEFYNVGTQDNKIITINYSQSDWGTAYLYYDEDKIIKIIVPTFKGDTYEHYFNNDRLFLEIHYGKEHELINIECAESNSFDYDYESKLLNLSKNALSNAKEYLK